MAPALKLIDFDNARRVGARMGDPTPPVCTPVSAAPEVVAAFADGTLGAMAASPSMDLFPLGLIIAQVCGVIAARDLM